jgi:hypothetical protein
MQIFPHPGKFSRQKKDDERNCIWFVLINCRKNGGWLFFFFQPNDQKKVLRCRKIEKELQKSFLWISRGTFNSHEIVPVWDMPVPFLEVKNRFAR